METQTDQINHGFSEGDAVMVREDLYEGPNDHSPGGYLARRYEKLIVRKVRINGEWPLCVSHESRTDGATFSVAPAEIEPWAQDPRAAAVAESYGYVTHGG